MLPWQRRSFCMKPCVSVEADMVPEILFEDNHLLILNKPAGILTQPSGTDQENLETICKAWLKETYKKPGNVFLEAVHRLDKPVSGIVIFAKTSKALSRLNASMRSKEWKKIYFAVVEGFFKSPEGTLEHYLQQGDFQSQVVSKDTPGAKLCRLHYRMIKQSNNLSLIEIDLETGRYHQIRAQLSANGNPIVGDTKYKSTTHYSEPTIALHNYKVEFPHPTKEEIIKIQAPLPKSIEEIC